MASFLKALDEGLRWKCLDSTIGTFNQKVLDGRPSDLNSTAGRVLVGALKVFLSLLTALIVTSPLLLICAPVTVTIALLAALATLILLIREPTIGERVGGTLGAALDRGISAGEDLLKTN